MMDSTAQLTSAGAVYGHAAACKQLYCLGSMALFLMQEGWAFLYARISDLGNFLHNLWITHGDICG